MQCLQGSIKFLELLYLEIFRCLMATETRHQLSVCSNQPFCSFEMLHKAGLAQGQWSFWVEAGEELSG